MIHHYRLQKQARIFFEDEAKSVKPMEHWEKRGIHPNLLEQVGRVYISYGIDKGGRTDLQGWSSSQQHDGEAHFDFTIKIANICHEDYKKFDAIQLMDAFEEFLNERVNL